jgi:20S proteasome alpha/beta subunit
LLAVSFGTSLRRRSHSARKKEQRARSVSRNDEVGVDLVMPAVEHAKEAIESVPRTLVVMRTKNCTIVAFTAPAEMGLLIPVSTSTVVPLVTPHIHMAVTGWAADNRLLRRYLREIVVNHTMEFVAPPSARFLAEKAGKFMERHVFGNGRLLASHAFIIDTRSRSLPSAEPASTNQTCHDTSNTTQTFRDYDATDIIEEMKRPIIYEIDPEGTVKAVLAGVAGRKRAHVFQKLESNLLDRIDQEMNDNQNKNIYSVLGMMTSEDAQNLIGGLLEDVVKSKSSDSRDVGPDNSRGSGHDEEEDDMLSTSTLLSKKAEQVIRFLVFPHKQ